MKMETVEIQVHECALFNARCRGNYHARTCQDLSCRWGATSTGEPTDRGAETLPIDTYLIDTSIVIKMPACDLSNAISVAQDLTFAVVPYLWGQESTWRQTCTFLWYCWHMCAFEIHLSSLLAFANAYRNEGGERICVRLEGSGSWLTSLENPF